MPKAIGTKVYCDSSKLVGACECPPDFTAEQAASMGIHRAVWYGTPCKADPDNCWTDNETGEHINAHTNERTPTHGGTKAA